MYVKAPIPSEVYHLTRRDEAGGAFWRTAQSGASMTRNAGSARASQKMKAYMEQTVLCEGKAYFGARRPALPLSEIRAG